VRRWLRNGAGWDIALKRTQAEKGPAQPVLIIPGYGMNSFIFGFHPRGPSLEAYLASRGLDVYSVDLRGQGDSRRTGGSLAYGLDDLAITDLGTALRGVLEWSGKDSVDLIGCSLGAALAFGHVALHPEAKVRALVSMGGVVTWVDPHPLVRAAFASPTVVGMIPMFGTRAFARRALPILARIAPRVLSIYLHGQSTDLSHAETMVKTVEDPSRRMNREIARWIGKRELSIGGVNVSRALPDLRYPTLVVVANQDGIVPPATGRAIFERVGSHDKRLLCVGDERTPIAHADLFIANDAHALVFAKIADFLVR
jgi:pimeloyl-ACP methyl ester carboxylesterase